MIYRTQNIRMLLAKLYRDLRLADATNDADFVEWTGEALAHIGAFPQLVKKEAVLEIQSNRAALPVDLVKTIAVAYAPGATLETVLQNTKKLLPLSGADFHAGIHTTAFTEEALREETFVLQPGYIHTSYEEGVVILAYLAYPVDEEGLPLVPDDVSFFEACKWYCALRMAEGGWRHPAGLNYFQIEERWLKYCSQARTGAIMPDASALERMTETMVRLVRDYDAIYRGHTREHQPTTPDLFSFDHIELDFFGLNP